MKLRTVIFVFLFFHLFQLNGQIDKEMERINADSLQKVLPIARYNKECFYLIPVNYNYRGRIMKRSGNYDGAVIYYQKALEYYISYKKAKGHIHFNLEEKKLSCEIEHDGIGREKAWEVEYAWKRKHKSLATEIIRDRVMILNKKLKKKISLNITDMKSEADEAIGTMVSLDLPYLTD